MYNWINNFFSEHYHCTNYAGEYSAVAEVKASVIQDSAIGPASYSVTASDLRPAIDGNRMFKFADDTYLVIPAVNCSTCTAEVKHIETWATTNNLRLNRAKSKEIVFFANGKRGSRRLYRRRAQPLNAYTVYEYSESSSTPSSLQPTMWIICCRRQQVYCTRCAFCAAVELLQIH